MRKSRIALLLLATLASAGTAHARTRYPESAATMASPRDGRGLLQRTIV